MPYVSPVQSRYNSESVEDCLGENLIKSSSLLQTGDVRMAREHVSRFLRPLHFKMQANTNSAATREKLQRPLKSSLEYWVAVKEIDLNCYIGIHIYPGMVT